jgi:hypothetical protein
MRARFGVSHRGYRHKDSRFRSAISLSLSPFYYIRRLWTVNNLNYTPTTLGVQSWREIASGAREQKGGGLNTTVIATLNLVRGMQFESVSVSYKHLLYIKLKTDRSKRITSWWLWIRSAYGTHTHTSYIETRLACFYIRAINLQPVSQYIYIYIYLFFFFFFFFLWIPFYLQAVRIL